MVVSGVSAAVDDYARSLGCPDSLKLGATYHANTPEYSVIKEEPPLLGPSNLRLQLLEASRPSQRYEDIFHHGCPQPSEDNDPCADVVEVFWTLVVGVLVWVIVC